MALPFLHLQGRPMWEHCDHDGTRIDGAPPRVRLAPRLKGGSADGASGDIPAVEPSWEQAWERARGAAVVVPCGPEDCEEHQVLLLDPQAGLLVLDGATWLPLPLGALFPFGRGASGAEPQSMPRARRLFLPSDFPAPPYPAGLALDPWQGLWLLDREGAALRRLGADGRVAASVALPPQCEPLRFGCSALGLVLADRRGPALLFRPWQGEWRGLRLPPPPSDPSPPVEPASMVAPTAEPAELIDLAADPTITWAAALIRQGAAHRLVVWDGRRWRNWPASTLRCPRHLLIDGPESVLVSEPAWGPGDSRPTPFTRILIRPAGLEAEEGYGVRGFDGRGLWRIGEAVYASVASGGRRLVRREGPLRQSGRVETWALDSGSYACHWHRLFVDVCLPAGTRLRVEARTADDLPPLEVRRGPRRPQDVAGDNPLEPPRPHRDDPWPPLASRTADDQEGWQALGQADRRPPLIDQPLEPPPASQPMMETLEWLVSTPPGRYLWLRLHLEGDGRRTPVLHGLRVSQPRPPLLERLPAFWRADPEGGALTERLLALFEGPLTELDHRTEALVRLFLPALAPAEALPWLADFLALSFDDQLPERVRRTLLGEIAGLYRRRGTLPGLQRLLSILAEAPVVIVEDFRLRRRTPGVLGRSSVVGPALELGGREGELALGSQTIGERREDRRMALAQAALMAYRDGEREANRPLCPSADPPSPGSGDPLTRWFGERAHRFTVLVPRDRSMALEAVLEQALEAHKPAHTLHQICWIEAGYCLERGVRVGVHRLGQPTRAAPPVLGQAVLGGGTDPLPGGPGPDACGSGQAVMPFLPMRSHQP